MQRSRTVVRLGGAAVDLDGAPVPVSNVRHVTLPGAMSRSRCSRRETMRPRAAAYKQATEGVCLQSTAPNPPRRFPNAEVSSGGIWILSPRRPDLGFRLARRIGFELASVGSTCVPRCPCAPHFPRRRLFA